MSGVRQTHRSPDGAKRSLAPASRRSPVARRPAYLQSKMAVSRPGDTQEREADQVATQVARSPRAGSLQRAGLEPGPLQEDQTLAPAPVAAARDIHRQEATEEEPLQTRLQRQEEEPAQAARLLRQMEEEEEPIQTRLARQAAEEEEPLQTRLWRQPREEEEEPLQTRLMPKGDPVAGQTLDPETEQRIEARRGMGTPLPEDVRADMEARFGHDFSSVHIHTDAEAADLAASLGARAFTVGQDVFFAPGEFAPETDAGRELLAHELTHVVQQGGGAARMVMRQGEETGSRDGAYQRGRGFIRFNTITIPGNYADAYAAKVPLIRHKAFSQDTRTSRQQEQWRSGVALSSSVGKLQQVFSAHPNAQSHSPGTYIFKVPSPNQPVTGTSPRFLHGSLENCGREASIPSWNHQGANVVPNRRDRITSYDVDHIVEEQVGAAAATGPDFDPKPGLDEPENFQLLHPTANSRKMNAIKSAVRQKVREFTDGNTETYRRKPFSDWHENPEGLLDALSVQFNGVSSGGNVEPEPEQVWSRTEIEGGNHIQALIDNNQIEFVPLAEFESSIPEGIVWIFHGPGGGYKITFDPDDAAQRRRILAPFEVTEVERDTGDPNLIMRLRVQVPAGNSTYKRFDEPKPVDVVSIGGAAKVGHFNSHRFAEIMNLRRQARAGEENETAAGLEAGPLSPLTLDRVEIVPDVGFVLEGQILPTVPLIGDADIRYRVSGEELALEKTFTVDEISAPAPLEVTQCTLTLSAGTAGFAADGQVDVAINNLGEGSLQARISSRDGLSIAGTFDFDSQLFDPAQVRFRYEDGSLSGGGTIGIPRGKVPGISRATIRAEFSETGFTGTGEATLDIPGVEQGTLTVSQSEEEGFSIGGTFQLSGDIPGIRGGSISATLRERPDGEGYSVSASGEAQPDIPGFDSNLAIRYEDGAITLEATAAYARGLLSGEVRFGATNRTLDAEGSPTGEPGDSLIAYGGGQVTIQIAPWLQGTAGIEFAPDGEVTVAGEIGLPDQIEIFPRKEIRKDIFSIDIPIPIVPGIFAEVGGGLDAHAGIGPGVIDQLRLGVEYTPSREQDTHVTGDAHLNIPADAGLRLSVHAGIGLGIPAASVSGGLEIGGELGLEGAAEAGVHIDWMPSTGLEIDAFGRLSAQPKFTFDISGYVEVEALFFTIYEERWELASYELGSNLTFGVRFPIHYKEGEPFDISLDDVEFEVPDVNPREILGDLMDAIA